MSRRRVWLLLGVVAAAGVGVLLTMGGGPAPRPGSTRPPPRQASASSTSSETSTTPNVQPQPARPAPSTEEFGISLNRLFEDGTFSQAEIDAQLRTLERTGAKLGRTDTLWEASEPTAPVAGVHHYSWAFDDRIAGSLAAHGLTWLPVIDYTAPWAESIPGQDHSPPVSASDYAAYAGAFAARYGAAGSFWREHPELADRPVSTFEIWNEPDNAEFWLPSPDAAAYSDLYLAARTAILAADPSARAIVGGLTQPTSFLSAMLAARPALHGHVDGVAVHPYGSPLVVLGKLRGDRSGLDSLGFPSVPLYVTEFGWTTSPPGALNYAPATVRPRYIESTLAELGHLDCGIASAVLYTWVTPEKNPTDLEDWYGIHSPDGAPTAASSAFASGLRVAESRAPTLRLCGR